MSRILPDHILPPEQAALSVFEAHLALILGVVALVAAVTAVLITVLVRKKARGKRK